MIPRTRSLAWLALLCGACATLANGDPGLDDPPSSRAGPFRLLVVGELGLNLVAPRAVRDDASQLRNGSVLDVDGDPATLDVEGYFAASAEDAEPGDPGARIVRVHATDGRSFANDREEVLALSHPWEADRVDAPSVLFDATGERRMYYEAGGGIGVAFESGEAFASEPEPILTRSDVPWADAPIKSPGAVLLSDGTYRLYYETEEDGRSVIGVAVSDDPDPEDETRHLGLSFEDHGVVLRRGRSDSVDELYVGSPFAVTATSSEGREILYVYYTALNAEEKQSITLAARFLEDEGETLEKSGAAMYRPTGGVAPREPCVVRFDAFSFLFSTQKAARDSDEVVVTVGVSPGDVELPAATM